MSRQRTSALWQLILGHVRVNDQIQNRQPLTLLMVIIIKGLVIVGLANALVLLSYS